MGFSSVIRRWALDDKMQRQPSKLGPYADRLSTGLLTQPRMLRNERRNVKLMYKDLVKLGLEAASKCDMSIFSN